MGLLCDATVLALVSPSVPPRPFAPPRANRAIISLRLTTTAAAGRLRSAEGPQETRRVLEPSEPVPCCPLRADIAADARPQQLRHIQGHPRCDRSAAPLADFKADACGITTIPESIAQCTQPQVLSLRSNKITKVFDVSSAVSPVPQPPSWCMPALMNAKAQ